MCRLGDAPPYDGLPHDYGKPCDCPECGGIDRPHVPGTDYYDGSIEADDDDEDRIEGAAEEWADYLEWQRSLGAVN